MTDIERRMAVKQFVADWKGKGDEKTRNTDLLAGIAAKGLFNNTLCLCSVDSVEIASRVCTWKRAASSCCISGWNKERTGGHAWNLR